MASVDELESLVSLRDSGALTEEEFQAQKVKMLDSATHSEKMPIRTKILYSVGALMIVATVFSLINEGAFDSRLVSMIKGGQMPGCKEHTVEQVVNGFMGNPSWESGAGEGGVQFVNVSGDIMLHEKKVRALVQFKVNESEGAFQYNAFEANGVPQNNLMAMALMKKMCESVPK